MTPTWTTSERVVVVLASMALALGLIAVLSGFFAGRDAAGVSAGTSSSVGVSFGDQGDEALRPGVLRPSYDSDPPTSGPHILVAVTRWQAPLETNELLSALAAGNVVLVYGSSQPPPALISLAHGYGQFTPRLAAAGQAVLLRSRPGQRGVIALAWTRMLRVSSPADPRLGDFIQARLGQGAPHR